MTTTLAAPPTAADIFQPIESEPHLLAASRGPYEDFQIITFHGLAAIITGDDVRVRETVRVQHEKGRPAAWRVSFWTNAGWQHFAYAATDDEGTPLTARYAASCALVAKLGLIGPREA